MSHKRKPMVICCLLLSVLGILLYTIALYSPFVDLQGAFFGQTIFFFIVACTVSEFWKNENVVKLVCTAYAAFIAYTIYNFKSYCYYFSSAGALLFIGILLIPVVPFVLRLREKNDALQHKMDGVLQCKPDDGEGDYEYTEEDVVAVFVKKNIPYYAKSFAEFERAGGNFVLQWNWCAFLFAEIWFFYRKMYLNGIFLFVASILFNIVLWFSGGWFFIGGILVRSIVGSCGKYLYFKHYKNKLASSNDDVTAKIRIAEIVGGTNFFFFILGVCMTLITLCFYFFVGKNVLIFLTAFHKFL